MQNRFECHPWVSFSRSLNEPKPLPRTNADPSNLKEGGICDNHSLWSPKEGDHFHLFSTHCPKSASEISWIVSYPKSLWMRNCRFIRFWMKLVSPGCTGRRILEIFWSLRHFNQLGRFSYTNRISRFHNWPWVKIFPSVGVSFSIW